MSMINLMKFNELKAKYELLLKQYDNLAKENKQLIRENEELKKELLQAEEAYENLYLDFEDAQNTIEYLELKEEN